MATGKTFRDASLPMLDRFRGLPSLFGLRPHVVTIRVRVWSGPRVGIGAYQDTNTGMKVDLSIGNVKVRNLSQRDVIASGGLYTDQDLVIGPVTPPFQGSVSDDNAINLFDPPTSSSSTEIFFKIQGPGMADPNGDWFKKIGQRTDLPFRYMLYVRKTGQVFL